MGSRTACTKLGMTALLFLSTVAATGSIALREARGQASPKAAAPSESQPAADPHDKDRVDIQATMKSFAEAFQTRDAKKLASHWTAEGEYQNDAGVSVRGRDALEASFAAFFEATPDVRSEVHPQSLRFLSQDAAIVEGTVAVRRGPAEPAKSAQYSVLFLRDGGQWRLAQMRETTEHAVTIEDLDWLIGDWKSVSDAGAEIQTSYSWDASKKFIHVRFTIQEKTVGFGGTQVIGVDPATGNLRSWTFEAGGGVAEADWEPDGDHWVLDAVGTLADGRTLIETNILRRIDANTLTWQSIDRTLDDVEVPDLPPVKITRVQPKQ